VLRNFRLLFCVKWPREARVSIPDVASMVAETLTGAGLAPEAIGPRDLLAWLRRLLNDDPGGDLTRYDEGLPIRRQAIFAETITTKTLDHVRIGRKEWRCLTPKAYPAAVDPLQTNQLFGGIDGSGLDSDQIPGPFLYCLTVLLEDQKTRLHTKTNMTLIQQGAGSFAPALARRKEEYLWAAGEIERGVKFYKIIPTLWVYDEPGKARKSLDRARRLWESQGYLMQEDRGILPILLIAALPFGLYDIGRNVDQIDRDYIVPADTVSTLMPVQGDFSGVGRPVLLFASRKGQLAGPDLMNKDAINHNALIAASSGSGKSFFVNYLVTNYFATGAKIRIIDIGGSYQKMTKMCGARYLDFRDDTEICINPFSRIADAEHDIPVIAPIIAQMVYSASDTAPSEVEMTLIKNGVRWAWEQEGVAAGVDTVHRYLRDYRQVGGQNGEILQAAEKLAFTLTDFTSSGPYGRFFNGPSTFDISGDDFVVLELAHLEPKKELFRVVTLQIINAVTKDLYLSDRKTPRFIVFDEAWKFLGKSGHLQEVIEEGYRRARKFRGSFNVITQSILDVKQFGSVGDVIQGNSAFKFYLESRDIERAASQKLIDYDPFALKMLKSVTSRKPRYSEIFMDTPFGYGVARLMVDPFSYYAFTSDGGEITEIEELVQEGKSYVEAIRAMVQKYRR
jgi:conjugal transfer ATP-binding protein TraC